MAIAYRIYTNDGAGGQVNYSAPAASTAGLSYVTGPLGLSTDTTIVVRAYDTVTGLEEANTVASVRVVIGADGTDLSGLPNAPHAVSVAPASAGGCRASWAYAPARGYGTPSGFKVYLTQGASVDYTAPAATVAYTPGVVGYTCHLAGPYTLSTYTAAVRSFNATGTEVNTATVTASLGPPAAYPMDPVTVSTGPAGG